MKQSMPALLCLVLVSGCNEKIGPLKVRQDQEESKEEKRESLAEARKGFTTKLTRKEADKAPPPKPPPGVLSTVHYNTPAGKMVAYLTPDPGDGKKHPAIIWIFGGFGNNIGDPAWKEGPPRNDQSAISFRKAGVVTMYPALRGANGNPGFQEGFFGEVDDVLAAADFLAKQKFVDPQRIYLGGHSTGGTLVLLTVEMSGRFRAVFSFGPTALVSGCGQAALPFESSDWNEARLRSPLFWLDPISSPAFVFEGDGQPGNIDSLKALSSATRNSMVHFHPVPGFDHFSVIQPLSRLIAQKIMKDDGKSCNITFKDEELAGLKK
jgi:hypothetical protein